MKREYKETALGGEAYTWDMDELEMKAKQKRAAMVDKWHKAYTAIRFTNSLTSNSPKQ